MPGNPPPPGALPAPLPLPRVVPVPDPVPAAAVVPRPVAAPSPVEFKPLPFPLPYRPPLPLPEPFKLSLRPPATAPASASPLATSAGVPLPAAIEGCPPLLLPAPGSAITVASSGATENKERSSIRGILVGTSGGGGTALSTSSPVCPRRSIGTSEISAGPGTGGLAGSSRGTMGSDASRAGTWLAAEIGNVIFGAGMGIYTGRRSAISPARIFITGFGGSATATSVGCATLGNAMNCRNSGGFLSAG